MQHKGRGPSLTGNTNDADQIQQATEDFGEAATESAHTFATSFQTVASAHADFAKNFSADQRQGTRQADGASERIRKERI